MSFPYQHQGLRRIGILNETLQTAFIAAAALSSGIFIRKYASIPSVSIILSLTIVHVATTLRFVDAVRFGAAKR